MLNYKQIIDGFQTVVECHTAGITFSSGPLHWLDASDQNRKFPYIFLRPLTSPGIQANENNRVFELYSLDVPPLDEGSPTLKMSQTEQYGYDIIGGVLNDYKQDITITIQNVSPLWESFQDRVCGWLYSITVSTTQSIPCL